MSTPPKTTAINAQFIAKMIGPLFAPPPVRYKVFYSGRAATKSWSICRALLIEAANKPLRILCCRMTMSSIADSVHKLLADQIINLGLSDRYVVEKATIYGKNGSEFRFAGIANNVTTIKSFEGIDRCFLEEAQDVTKEGYETLIPTIRKPGSQIIICFNPTTEDAETYQRFVVNTPPNTIVTKLSYLDNPWLPDVLKDEAEYLKKTDPDAYNHIWLGFPRVHLENAVYASEIRQAQEDGRLTKVPYDNTVPVNTFWDLGRADSTCILFGQMVGMEFRVIDYVEQSGKSIHDYIKLLQSKPYIYGTDYLPHDAKARTLGTRRSIQEIMISNGRKVQIVPKLSIRDGINACRTIFPRTYIDEQKCARLVECLRKYRYDPNSAKEEPLHDQYSHGADAWRYCAIALRPPPTGVRPVTRAVNTLGNTGWMA